MNDYLKSKTIRSAIVVAFIVGMQLIGVGDPQVAETIDAVAPEGAVDVQQILQLLSLLGLGGVAYGRAVAKGPLKKEPK